MYAPEGSSWTKEDPHSPGVLYVWGLRHKATIAPRSIFSCFLSIERDLVLIWTKISEIFDCEYYLVLVTERVIFVAQPYRVSANHTTRNRIYLLVAFLQVRFRKHPILWEQEDSLSIRWCINSSFYPGSNFLTHASSVPSE